MKKIFLCLFVLTLTGCAQFTSSTSDTLPSVSNLSWQQHQQRIQELKDWSISGKLAIFLEDDRQSANIFWQQQSNNYNIQLTTFIGTQVLQVTKNEQGIKIIDNDDQVFTGQDTNTLIKQIAPGIDLPIKELQQWIKGNPVNASYQLNQQLQVEELLGFDQSGASWEVKYQDYQPYSEYYLPKKIELTREGIRLKISISQWQTTLQ